MALPVQSNTKRLPGTRHWRFYQDAPMPSLRSGHYIAAALASGFLWLIIGETSGSSLGTVLGVTTMGLIVVSVPLLVARRQLVPGLIVLVYLAAVQPALRTYVPALRYNILEYTLPVSVFFLLIQRRKFILSLPTFLYMMYLGLELIGVIKAERLDIVRAVLFSSFTLFLLLLVADQIKLNAQQLTHIWKGYLVGALSIILLVARILFSDAIITWTTASNAQVSAGMGPNQVSFILSVGVFLALVLGEQTTGQGRWFYRLLAGLLAYFMILTFSRGGLYIVAGAIFCYYLFFQRPRRSTWPILISFILLLYIVLSLASDTTQGLVLERYRQLETTNRLLLVAQGWRIFLDNPLLGVGTANYHLAVSANDLFGSVSGAHNEFIRAAAEHGIFGLTFWGLFAISSIVLVLRKYSGRDRALCLALLFVAFASMFYNGLKLIVQPMLILMAFTFLPEDSDSEGKADTKRGQRFHGVPQAARLRVISQPTPQKFVPNKRIT
jgi:O-antigen ligase